MTRTSLAPVINLQEERKKRMPRSKTKSKSDEIDDLVDDLDELEDEEVDEEEEDEDEEEDEEDEEDDEDEDPDEAPKARKGRSKRAPAKAKKERSGIGTVEVAEAAGTNPRALRGFLRAKGYQPRDDREGRYNWKSLNDPEVKKILREVRAGELKAQNKEKLAGLKGKKKSTAKKTAAKPAAKKTAARKRRSSK